MTKDQEALVTENMRLAYYIARRKYRNCGMELEDTEATALLGLVKAAITFKPEKGISFSTYAGACIDNEIRLELRKKKRHEYEYRENVMSLQEVICQNGRREGTLADVIADGHDAHKQVEDVLFLNQLMQSGIFSDQDKLILRLVFLDGYNQARAGKHAGVSQPYVSRLLRMVNGKARQWAAR